jgi:outer membrane protein assembly factor BamB
MLAVLAGIASWRARESGLDPEDARAADALARRLAREEGPEGWALQIGGSTVAVEEKAGRVLRRDATGRVEWSTSLGGDLRKSWQPRLLTDSRRIFVKEPFKGVVALDAESGKVLWRAAAPIECFGLIADRVLTADGRQLVALATDSGAEVFRLSLPADDDYFRPVAIGEAAGLFLVQTHEAPGGKGDAFLIDRTGQVRHRFPRQVVDARPAGEDRVFLTSADIRRVAPDDKTVWATPLANRMWIAGGRLLEVPGGDLVAFLYGRIANTGVQLMRIDPVRGEKRWEAYCAPLPGVTHSIYKHNVDVESVGNRLRVISQGSAGWFVEWLDGQTGESVRRNQQRR